MWTWPFWRVPCRAVLRRRARARRGWAFCCPIRVDSTIPDEDIRAVRACCEAATAECLACVVSEMVDHFCMEWPEVLQCSLRDSEVGAGVPPQPAQGMRQPGISEPFPSDEQEANSDHATPVPDPSRSCCKEGKAECLACAIARTVEQFCTKWPETPQCSETETAPTGASAGAVMSAKSTTPQITGSPVPFDGPVTEQEGAIPEPDAQGGVMPKSEQDFAKPESGCCWAMTASCLACSSGSTVEEICKERPDTAECPHTKQTEADSGELPMPGVDEQPVSTESPANASVERSRSSAPHCLGGVLACWTALLVTLRLTLMGASV